MFLSSTTIWSKRFGHTCIWKRTQLSHTRDASASIYLSYSDKDPFIDRIEISVDAAKADNSEVTTMSSRSTSGEYLRIDRLSLGAMLFVVQQRSPGRSFWHTSYMFPPHDIEIVEVDAIILFSNSTGGA